MCIQNINTPTCNPCTAWLAVHGSRGQTTRAPSKPQNPQGHQEHGWSHGQNVAMGHQEYQRTRHAMRRDATRRDATRRHTTRSPSTSVSASAFPSSSPPNAPGPAHPPNARLNTLGQHAWASTHGPTREKTRRSPRALSCNMIVEVTASSNQPDRIKSSRRRTNPIHQLSWQKRQNELPI